MNESSLCFISSLGWVKWFNESLQSPGIHRQRHESTWMVWTGLAFSSGARIHSWVSKKPLLMVDPALPTRWKSSGMSLIMASEKSLESTDLTISATCSSDNFVSTVPEGRPMDLNTILGSKSMQLLLSPYYVLHKKLHGQYFQNPMSCYFCALSARLSSIATTGWHVLVPIASRDDLIVEPLAVSRLTWEHWTEVGKAVPSLRFHRHVSCPCFASLMHQKNQAGEFFGRFPEHLQSLACGNAFLLRTHSREWWKSKMSIWLGARQKTRSTHLHWPIRCPSNNGIVWTQELKLCCFARMSLWQNGLVRKNRSRRACEVAGYRKKSFRKNRSLKKVGSKSHHQQKDVLRLFAFDNPHNYTWKLFAIIWPNIINCKCVKPGLSTPIVQARLLPSSWSWSKWKLLRPSWSPCRGSPEGGRMIGGNSKLTEWVWKASRVNRGFGHMRAGELHIYSLTSAGCRDERIVKS